MADGGCIGLRFFRIMLPNFSVKLQIPECLADHLIEDESRDKATIVRRDGKLWNVDLFVDNNNDNMYMGGEGWRQFLQANHFSEGFVLLLRYKGSFMFSFRVYDLSTFERPCPVVSSHKSSIMGKEIEMDCDEDENSNFVPELRTCSDKGLMKGEGSSSRTMKAEESKRGKRMVVDDSEDGESYGKLKKSTTDSKEKISFEITIRPWNLTRGFLPMPVKFRKSCGISTEHKEAVIRNSQGKCWLLGLIHTHHCGAQISRGWSEFTRANKLKEEIGLCLSSCVLKGTTK